MKLVTAQEMKEIDKLATEKYGVPGLVLMDAAAKQVEDIILIRDTYGLERLPDNLREMAEVRMEYPDATLKELGEYLTPAVGKSGVNHRLRKLSELADRIRV